MSKFNQMSIGRQVLVAYGALCLVLAMIGALCLFSLRAIEHRRQTQQAVAHQKWEVIDEVAKNVGLMQAEVLQHVLATDAAEMKRRNQIIRALHNERVGFHLLKVGAVVGEKCRARKLPCYFGIS